MSVDLLREFVAKALGKDLDTLEPEPVSPDECMKLVWPLNEWFRPRMETIEGTAYSAAAEPQADFAIERFAFGNGVAEWEALPPEVWRVLFERHRQFLILAGARKASGESVMLSLPEGLPFEHRLPALMLFWLHQMKLPWPPGGPQPGSAGQAGGRPSGGPR